MSINLEPTDVPGEFRWTDFGIFYRLTDDNKAYWVSDMSAAEPLYRLKDTNPTIIAALIAASQALQGKQVKPDTIEVQVSGGCSLEIPASTRIAQSAAVVEGFLKSDYSHAVYDPAIQSHWRYSPVDAKWSFLYPGMTTWEPLDMDTLPGPCVDRLCTAYNHFWPEEQSLLMSKSVPGDYIGLPVPKQAEPYLAEKREHTPRPGCWSFRALPEEVDFARIVHEFNEACPGQDMTVTLQHRRTDKRGRVRVVVSTPWRGKQAQERPKMTSWEDSHGDTWIPGPTRDEVVWMFLDSDGDPSCRRLSWLFASEETHEVSWRKHIKQAFAKLWGRTE